MGDDDIWWVSIYTNGSAEDKGYKQRKIETTTVRHHTCLDTFPSLAPTCKFGIVLEFSLNRFQEIVTAQEFTAELLQHILSG